MKLVFIIFSCLFLISYSQYQNNRPPPRNYYDRPYYDQYYDPYEPVILNKTPRPAAKQSVPVKNLNQIVSIIFSCVAMLCAMFVKRPIIKRIIKSKEATFINEVGMIAESSREIGVISLGLLNSAEFHTFGDVTVGAVLNILIFTLALYYCPKERKQTLTACLIGFTVFFYSFISKTINPDFIRVLPFIGATLLVSFRLSLIPKLIQTKTIIGTMTYQSLYLGATGLFCRMMSFVVVSKMHWGRIYFIGGPFLSMLILIYVHHKYSIKQPKNKKFYEQDSHTQTSQISFSKKSK